MKWAVCTARGVPVFVAWDLVPAQKGHVHLCPGSQDSILRGLDFKRNGGNPLLDQSSSKTARDGYSFRGFGHLIQLLVTPAITENILQFSCVEHGQQILFKDSYARQSIFFPFPFIFHAKKLVWKALHFWMPCHWNLTALLRMKSYTQNGRNFAAPVTLILQ